MNRRLRRSCIGWCALVALTGAFSVLTIQDIVPRAIFLAWALAGAFSAGYLLATEPTERG